MTRLEVAREAVSRMVPEGDPIRPMVMAFFEVIYASKHHPSMYAHLNEKCPPEEVNSITETVQAGYLKGFFCTEKPQNN